MSAPPARSLRRFWKHLSDRGRFEPASSAEDGTSVAAELLGHDDLSMLARKTRRYPIGVSVMAKVDFMMKD